MVDIKQIYSCDKVTKASELYFISELGKYLFIRYGEVLSLKDISFSKELSRTAVWDILRIAYKNGYICDVNVPDKYLLIDIQSPLLATKKSLVNVFLTTDPVSFDKEDNEKRQKDMTYALCTPLHRQISFEVDEGLNWFWSISGKEHRCFDINNQTFNNTISNINYQIWCSFIAYVTIERFKTGFPDTLVLEIGTQVLGLTKTALVYLFSVFDNTDALKDWVRIIFETQVSDMDKLHTYFNAWYQDGKDLGLVSSMHTLQDKLKYMKRIDMTEGDVVLVYERPPLQVKGFTKNILGVKIAIIDSLNKDKVRLRYIISHKTHEQAVEEWKDKTMSVKHMYEYKVPFYNPVISIETTDLYSLGIGHMLFNETKFLVPLDEAYDEVVNWVSDGTRKTKLRLPQNDLIYWIFKENNIEFNEKRFLDRYFKDEKPLYTRYMLGEDLEEYQVG